MMNGGSKGCGGEREKEGEKAGECRETKKGSTKIHFGIASGKGANESARNTASFSLQGTMN
jgi:hypothetical protein